MNTISISLTPDEHRAIKRTYQRGAFVDLVRDRLIGQMTTTPIQWQDQTISVEPNFRERGTGRATAWAINVTDEQRRFAVYLATMSGNLTITDGLRTLIADLIPKETT
jgi:hypothetical protein